MPGTIQGTEDTEVSKALNQIRVMFYVLVKEYLTENIQPFKQDLGGLTLIVNQ